MTLSKHAGLFLGFYNPARNSDVDCRIFKVHVRSFCLLIHTGGGGGGGTSVYYLIGRMQRQQKIPVEAAVRYKVKDGLTVKISGEKKKKKEEVCKSPHPVHSTGSSLSKGLISLQVYRGHS